jgi:hypothetical protein
MLLYAVTKMVAYVLWCWAGIYFLANKMPNLSTAVGLGVVRWTLGLFFGVIVFFSVHLNAEDNATAMYFAIYTPVRILEWGILLFLMCSWLGDKPRGLSIWRSVLWIIGGVVVSFLSDLLSPEGLAGRFCVGRCLC